MIRFSVSFYQDEKGFKPVLSFIRSLNVKLQAKVVSDMQLLEEYGYLAREPLSKSLGDCIFELRSKVGTDIVRILYFFDKEQIIIATNGFVKKQQRTPKKEIALAKQRRTNYLKRRHDREGV